MPSKPSTNPGEKRNACLDLLGDRIIDKQICFTQNPLQFREILIFMSESNKNKEDVELKHLLKVSQIYHHSETPTSYQTEALVSAYCSSH